MNETQLKLQNMKALIEEGIIEPPTTTKSFLRMIDSLLNKECSTHSRGGVETELDTYIKNKLKNAGGALVYISKLSDYFYRNEYSSKIIETVAIKHKTDAPFIFILNSMKQRGLIEILGKKVKLI